MGKCIISLLLLVSSVTSLMSQTIKINPKPGAVSAEELEMSSYPLDTAASAVVLYKRHEVKVAFDSRLALKRTETIFKRYKVLKDDGKDCADEAVLYLADRSANEMVFNIKVTTYNSENGKTVTSKLPSKLIFKDSYSDIFKQVKFSAPDVRVGSVIEVQYTLSSDMFWNVGLLFLQEPYPVNQGIISVEYADYFTFNVLSRGYSSFNDVKHNERAETFSMPGDVLRFQLKEDVYSAHDVPALKRESFCIYPDQSRLGVEYELRSVQIPGAVYKDYTTSWQDVDKQFVSEGFLKGFNSKSDVNSLLATVGSVGDDEVGFIRDVRKAILAQVKWNGNTAMFPNASKALKEKTGNSADICGIMACVLNNSGFECSPVLIKSRSRGVLASFHVSTDAFNAVILKIKTPSGKVYYTDVASDSGYLDVLPMDYLVDKARVLDINDKIGSFEDISARTRNSYTQSVVLHIGSDGSINGESRVIAMNQSSKSEKLSYSDSKNEDDFIENLEHRYGVEITEFDFPDKKEWSPKATMTIKFTDEADVSGDYIYVKPFINQFHSARDLQDPVRRSLIDFPYPETIKYSCSLFVPAGYVVDQMPESKGFTCPILGGKAIVKYVPFGENGVMMTFLYSFSNMRVPPTDYDTLREFWADLCNMYDATIVLKKK